MSDTKVLFPTFAVKAQEQTKENLINNFIRYMLSRTQSMFIYDGLPKTIPAKWLEFYLQTNGNVFVTKVNENLYAFTGGMGGAPNEYYLPTIYTVANPALNISKNYKIDVEGVLIYNDASNMGLIPLMSKYGSLLAENYISMRIASIMARATALISASDDNTKRSAEQYIQKLVDGEISIVGENAFFDGVKVQPTRQAGITGITDLIELEQYLKASFYNEIGLNANYNMKREAINANESQLNNDALTPLIDQMLTERKDGVEKINDMFETNISVEFNSAWKENEIEHAAEIEEIKNGGEQSNRLDDESGGGENGDNSTTD